MRIGFGYDIHRLKRGRRLVLGGVALPAHKGEAGHSDGDVLLHALIDALLGAAGLQDIGEYFPPGDARLRNIASTELLKETLRLIRAKGFNIKNIDLVIILEKPYLKDHKEQIKSNLASLLDLRIEDIAVKAKTKEGLDSTGKGRAIEAYAVVLLQ